MTGIVLDTGALIALERRHRLRAVDLTIAFEAHVRIAVPTGCVAQAWRDGARQVELARLLRSSDVELRPLDGSDARRVGESLGRTGTSDVVDAHVALVAVRDGRTIFTSDPDDLRVLAPGARIEAV